LIKTTVIVQIVIRELITVLHAGKHLYIRIRTYKVKILTFGNETYHVRNLGHALARVRFRMVSLEFFVDIILAVALWPWGRFSL
jgi:hypothetical protein